LLWDSVQPSVEVEILEGGQLAVEQGFMAEKADTSSFGRDLEGAARRRGKPGEEAEERRLPGAVRPGDEGEAAGRQVEIDAVHGTPLAELSRQRARADHSRHSRCDER
jgi:hypothetical protein